MTACTLRSNTGYSDGKRYVEFKVISAPSSRPIYVGVDDGTQNYVAPRDLGIGESPFYVGSVAYKSNGRIYSNTSTLNNVSSGGIQASPYTVGDTVGMRIDLDLGNISFYLNNVLQATVPYAVEITTYVSVSLTSKGQSVQVRLLNSSPLSYSIPSGYTSWEGGPEAPPIQEPGGLTYGTQQIETSSSSITVPLPESVSVNGTVYVFLVHRGDLTTSSEWEIVASQDIEDSPQVLTLVKSPYTPSIDMEFTQSVTDRFYGQSLYLETDGDQVETVQSIYVDAADGNEWTEGPTLVAPGNGVFFGAASSYISNTSSREFLTNIDQVSPEDIPDNRLCVGTAPIYKGLTASPSFKHEQNSSNQFAYMVVSITNLEDAPAELSTQPMVMEWNYDVTSPSVVLPLVSTGNYDFYVQWKGGGVYKVDSYDSLKAERAFTDGYSELTSIYGTCDHLCFGDVTSSRLAISDILQWGDVEFTSCRDMFKNTEFSSISAVDSPNVSNCTDFSGMFYGAELQSAPTMDLSSAETVEDMYYLSSIVTTPYMDTPVCTNFHGIFQGSNITNFGGMDTSNAEDMSNVFYDADNIVSFDVDTSTATTINGIVVNATNLVNAGTLDLTNNTTSLSLNNCSSLTTISILNASVNLYLDGSQIDWPVLEQIFEDLPDRTLEPSRQVRCTGLPAVSHPSFDASIATSKGWTVTT